MATIDGVIDGVNLGNNGNGTSVVYPYPPYGNNGGFGNGMDGLWGLIALAIVFGGFGGNNNAYGNMMYDINANTNRGFDQLAVTSGINDLQNAISNGFTNAEVGRCNQTTTLLQSLNSLGTQFQNCCCENRLATADLKYTVATENCADRQAIAMGIRDVIESNNRNSQLILDKLNAQTLEAKNDEIAQLRQEVLFARGQASQIAQNEQIVNQIYNRLDTCPVGTTPVFGRTPIFTCPNNNGCGCGQSIQ